MGAEEQMKVQELMWNHQQKLLGKPTSEQIVSTCKKVTEIYDYTFKNKFLIRTSSLAENGNDTEESVGRERISIRGHTI